METGREADIQKLINGVLEMDLDFWDNPNGPYEYTCPFCYETVRVGGKDKTPIITDFPHDPKTCLWLIAKDLNTKQH